MISESENDLELVIRRVLANQFEIHQSWVTISHQIAVNPYGNFISYRIQALGRIDAFLREYEPYVTNKTHNEILYSLDFFSTLSAFWVLGLFDVVKIIVDVVKIIGLKKYGDFENFKKKLLYIRTPLAKHQVRDKNEFHVPEAQIMANGKYGWAVLDKSGNRIDLGRTELADEFLNIAKQNFPINLV